MLLRRNSWKVRMLLVLARVIPAIEIMPVRVGADLDGWVSVQWV